MKDVKKHQRKKKNAQNEKIEEKNISLLISDSFTHQGRDHGQVGFTSYRKYLPFEPFLSLKVYLVGIIPLYEHMYDLLSYEHMYI